MTADQGTLIYIEKENITEAEFMSRSFVNKGVKNRAYLNALGAELLMKYLKSEGVNVSDVHNMHSISKVLENIDIADVLLSNIHIDVRVVFSENQIFVPKSHFNFEIVPDVYVVLKIDEEFKNVEFLGYFKPSQINKQSQNSDYYFFSKKKLSTPESLVKFIKNFPGKAKRTLTEEDFLRGRELSVSLADHNLSEDEMREFLELLLLSSELRDSVLEFDNFETLAYSVASTLGSQEEPATFTLITDDEDDVEPAPAETLESDDIQNEEINLSSMMLDDDISIDESLLDEDIASVEENEETEMDIEGDIEPVDDGGFEQSEEMLDTSDELEFTENNTISIDVDEPQVILEEAEDIPEVETVAKSEEEDSVLFDFNEEKADQDEIPQQTGVEEEVLEESPLLDIGSVDLGDDLLGDDDSFENDMPQIDAEPVQNSDEDLLDFSVKNEVDVDSSPVLEEVPEVEVVDMPAANTVLSVDALLDETIAAIDDNKPEISDVTDEKPKNDDITKGLAEAFSNAVEGAIAKSTGLAAGTAIAAGAGAAAAEAGAAAKGAEVAGEVVDAVVDASAAVSDGAIKLASVSGDMVDNVVGKNLEKQQKNLDRIDYAKTDIAPDTAEIPEHIKALGDLSVAKLEANLEAEISGQFDVPKDLADLNTVELKTEDEVFEHETINFGAMDSVELDDFEDTSDDASNLSSFSNMGAASNVALPDINVDDENVGMDLPGMSSYTINEDGTSSMDSFDTDMSLGNSGDEHLVDFGIKGNLNEISIDDTNALDFGEMSVGEDLSVENTIDLPAQNNFDIGVDDSEPLVSEVEEPVNEISEPIFSDQAASDELSFESSEIEEEPILEVSDFEQSPINEGVTSVSDDISTPVLDEFAQVNVGNETFDNLEDIEQVQNSEVPISDELSLDDFDALGTETDVQEIPDEQSFDETAAPLPVENPEQEWMDDTNYDNLQDVVPQEIEQVAVVSESVQPVEDELIIEPEAEEKVYKVVENSTVISDRTFQTGEIPIDINTTDIPLPQQSEPLESLYNPDAKVPGAALLNNPGRLGRASGAGKPGLGIGLGIVGTLIALALVGVIGFSVAKMFKAPTEEAPQPITDDAVPTNPDNGVSDANTLNVDPNNVVNMDNNTNALASTSQPAATQPKPQAAAPAQPVKKGPATTFIEVKKLTWEVPDYISYNQAFKQYFQSVGKSLKLSLTSDLLLAKDYIYSNEVRVSVTFAKDGTFKSSQIVISSGSAEIDKIVLQTVNQTMKALKAPHSVGNDESTTAILKIYF